MEPSHFESLYPEDTRLEEVKKILGYIKTGSSAQVIGIPGSGRSNVLGLLSYNKNVRIRHLGENQKWFHFVYMDFSEVRKRTSYDVIKFILISTAYSLSERNLKQEYETVNKFLKDAIGFNDELILFQALKKTMDYLAIEKELTIVLLFDRFEQYIQDANEQFFMNLKILRNRAKYRFSAVFSLSRPIEELLEPFILSEFYEYLSSNMVYLKLYDKAGIDFRFSYIEKVTGKKADEATRKEILKLTGGHGKLARLSYESFLGNEEKIKNLKEFLLGRSVIKQALSEIWNFLTPYEKMSLKEKKNTEDLSDLLNCGLIKNNEMTIPLLEDFIKDQNLERKENISYIPEKNEIIKGEELLTEKLSPSEFRLLRFFVQNPDKVCEKEEIINAVWKDSKTQEGVTDQALDQIIYRLRKKIEINPNNPTHLQTIKGKGFRFIP